MSETLAHPAEELPYQQIAIFDTTLRDGAQSPGIALSQSESLTIAHQLRRLGVDVIEAGFPISSKANFAAVQAISREVEGPVIAGLARANSDDIDAAGRAVADAPKPRIHTFISTSDIHIEHQMGNSRNDVKGLARAAVAQAKLMVEDVEFSPMDATRSDPEFTAEVIQIAIDEGATVINVPDTVGYTQPDEYKQFLAKLYQHVPALGGVVLSVHCHDDLGLAVANSFAGVQVGARQVECAINGLGERAGNASLEEIVMLLRTRRKIDGFDTSINSQLLVPTSDMVARFTGYPVPRNKAVVGGNAFRHESGIHQDGVIKERNTFEIMRAEDVGADPDNKLPLGKQSGRAAVGESLERSGVLNPEYLKSTFRLFKELADQIGEISDRQIAEIHLEDQRRQANPRRLVNYTMSAAANHQLYQATVEVEEKGARSRTIKAASGVSDVDGGTSAIFSAIEAATATNYEVEEHELTSIGSGKQTIGKAKVVLRLNGHLVAGYGLSLDTGRATALAHLDAIAKAENYSESIQFPSI